jgi:hypothetical protein
MKTNRSLTGGPALPANTTCNPQPTAALESCARPGRWRMLGFTAAISLTLGFASLHAAAPLQYNGDYLGGRLIYDPNTDLTWYQAPYTNVNWSVAMDWAANLYIGGTNGWQLPSIAPLTPEALDAGATNFDEGQLGYLWYVELGNHLGALTNPGPFDPTIWQNTVYWTSGGPYYAHLSGFAVYFSIDAGNYGFGVIPPWTPAYGAEIAVHAGDIGPNGPLGPLLTVTRSGNSIIVSWPSPSTGWTLQQCSDLAAGNWPASGLTVSDDGTNCSVTISAPAGNLFFRLAK